MASSQALNEHFGKQPTQKEINPEIASLLSQYGLRYRNITKKITSPQEKAMVDLELLALEANIAERVKAHEMRTYALLAGEEVFTDLESDETGSLLTLPPPTKPIMESDAKLDKAA